MGNLKRILVIGSPGAGKSTFSRRLAEILNIEVFHLDRLHWRPGWVEPSDAEWSQIVSDLVAKEEWIIDGNYGGVTMDIRLARADTVIFLDYPRLVCLWRVLKRRWMYHGKTRPDMAPGCPEKLDMGLIRFIWYYPEKSRPSVMQQILQHKVKDIYIFRHPREADSFLRTVASRR